MYPALHDLKQKDNRSIYLLKMAHVARLNRKNGEFFQNDGYCESAETFELSSS